MSFISKIKQYPKDAVLVLGVILVGLLAVSADGFSDLANKKFWWNFWSVIHVAAIVACVAGWIYLKNKDKSSS